MGVEEIKKKIPFTSDNVKDRELILRMLRFEDQYGKSDVCQNLYKAKLNFPRESLHVTYTIHRYVLDHFDFDTSDESVETYRTIFGNYYNSPTDYDKEVLDSVYYMKNNKCVYYTSCEFQLGDQLKDCNLLKLDGASTTLFESLNKEKYKYAIIGSFSTS